MAIISASEIYSIYCFNNAFLFVNKLKNIKKIKCGKTATETVLDSYSYYIMFLWETLL